MKKFRIRTFVGIMVILLCMPFHMLAEEKNADVIFDGNDIQVVKDSNLAKSFSGLLPGDEINIDITFANTSGKETNWYISSEVLKSLEDGSSAANDGYEYQLIYIDPQGNSSILYDNSSLGGDKVSGMEVGLHQANEAMEDYFYLDSLKKEESGTIRFHIGLDGESQPNSYMDTAARLQISFAVEEEVENIVHYSIVNTSDYGYAQESAEKAIVHTGFYFSFTMTLALGGMLLFGNKRDRKEGAQA